MKPKSKFSMSFDDIARYFVGKSAWLYAGAAFLLVGAAIVVWIFFWPNSFDDPSERAVFVSKGATFSEVLDSLDRSGIIYSRSALKVAGRLLGWTQSVQVGKYVFSSGLSNLSILMMLKDGSGRSMISVTIPEGSRLESIAARFGHEIGNGPEEFLALCRTAEFIRGEGIDAASLEGYLLPDTYAFHWQTGEKEIIGSIVAAFRAFYNDSLQARQRQMNMTLNEVLTLASIVEAETRRGEERAIVSGVYHNRLKKRMRLEADPTVQYVIPDGPRRLLYSDLKTPSPYNTYLNYGLPPGPINSPGRASIIAALYPEVHSYLFFVADGYGGHVFSRNFQEHQRASRQYRRNRRLLQQGITPSSSVQGF